MKRKIAMLEIDGAALPLLFNLQAEFELADMYGSMDVIFDAVRGETAEEKLVREQVEGKREEEKFDLKRHLPEIVAVLARQGAEYLGDEEAKQKATEKWLMMHASPADVREMAEKMVEALYKGLKTQHGNRAEKEEDLVQAAIEKN